MNRTESQKKEILTIKLLGRVFKFRDQVGSRNIYCNGKWLLDVEKSLNSNSWMAELCLPDTVHFHQASVSVIGEGKTRSAALKSLEKMIGHLNKLTRSEDNVRKDLCSSQVFHS